MIFPAFKFMIIKSFIEKITDFGFKQKRPLVFIKEIDGDSWGYLELEIQPDRIHKKVTITVMVGVRNQQVESLQTRYLHYGLKSSDSPTILTGLDEIGGKRPYVFIMGRSLQTEINRFKSDYNRYGKKYIVKNSSLQDLQNTVNRGKVPEDERSLSPLIDSILHHENDKTKIFVKELGKNKVDPKEVSQYISYISRDSAGTGEPFIKIGNKRPVKTFFTNRFIKGGLITSLNDRMFVNFPYPDWLVYPPGYPQILWRFTNEKGEIFKIQIWKGHYPWGFGGEVGVYKWYKYKESRVQYKGEKGLWMPYCKERGGGTFKIKAQFILKSKPIIEYEETTWWLTVFDKAKEFRKLRGFDVELAFKITGLKGWTDQWRRWQAGRNSVAGDKLTQDFAIKREVN